MTAHSAMVSLHTSLLEDFKSAMVWGAMAQKILAVGGLKHIFKEEEDLQTMDMTHVEKSCAATCKDKRNQHRVVKHQVGRQDSDGEAEQDLAKSTPPLRRHLCASASATPVASACHCTTLTCHVTSHAQLEKETSVCVCMEPHFVVCGGGSCSQEAGRSQGARRRPRTRH